MFSNVMFLISIKGQRQVGQFARRGLHSLQMLWPFSQRVIGGDMYSKHTGHSSASSRFCLRSENAFLDVLAGTGLGSTAQTSCFCCLGVWLGLPSSLLMSLTISICLEAMLVDSNLRSFLPMKEFVSWYLPKCFYYFSKTLSLDTDCQTASYALAV